MSYIPYNPSYYRNHQYAHQFNLPDSAFVNRKRPDYTSEMPQGMNAFEPSHRRHFQNVGYNSIISQEKILSHQSPEETESPAKNKDYYRNLSIEDIEGASTNTLISKAIKNRIKAKEYYLRREKSRQAEESARKARYVTASEQSNKQQQAQKIINQYKNEINYHERIRKIKTEQSRQDEPQSYQNQLVQQYKNDLLTTEKEIQQLQRKLQNARKRVVQEKADHKRSGLVIEKHHLGQISRSMANQVPPSNELRLPNISHNPYKNPAAFRRNGEMQVPKNFDKQQRKRSFTLPAEQSQNGKEMDYYPAKDRVIEKEEKTNRHDNEERIMQSRARRRQIRKMNPTHLSYGSFAGMHQSRMVYL